MKGRKTGRDQTMSDLEGLIQRAATEESKTELGKQGKRRPLPKANHGRKQQMVVFTLFQTRVVELLGLLEGDMVLPQKTGSCHPGSFFRLR